MTSAITFEELLAWNEEASRFWKAYLEAYPDALAVPCSIGGTANVQELVSHIWGVDLLWAQRIAGLPVTDRKEWPAGPVEALYDLHRRGAVIFHQLLDDPAQDWSAPYLSADRPLPAEIGPVSRRKVMLHALFHSQRHWAQLATLLRVAGHPTKFRGDFLFSSAMQ
jgi:uncharacterized damage-inducible protein DinB